MKKLSFAACASLFILAPLLASPSFAQSGDAEPASRAINDSFLKTLPFTDRADFDDVSAASLRRCRTG